MPRPRPNGNNNLPGKPPICPPLGGRLFRRGMRSPLPKSQFSLPRPYPINVRARRALRIYYLLFLIYYLNCPSPAKPHPPHISPGTLPRPKNAPPGRFCPAVRKTRGAGCSRPRWCTDPQHPGKLQQKNSLTSPINLYLPFISPGTLPRANKAPLGLCCRSVRKATDTPCSRPR